MKRLLLFMVSVLCFQFISAQESSKSKRESIEWLDTWAPNTRKTDLPRVLLIGNSITRLYNKNVEKQLEGKAYVARYASSKSIGDPTLLEELSTFMRQYSFDVIHFNNGMHGWGYTEEEYRQAFPKYFEIIKKYAPHAKYIWATTTPRRTGKGMKELNQQLTDRIKERNKIAADYFADKPEVKTNDLFSVVVRNPTYYEGGDGTHPNALGVKALANRVADNISEVLGKKVDLVHFPKGYSPEEVGNRLGNHFIPGKHFLHDGKWIHYAEVCTWLGALRFAEASKNADLMKKLQDRFDNLVNNEKQLLPIKNHVDLNMFGSLPLEFYKVTNDKQYLNLGLPYADTQWKVPADTSAEAKAWAKQGYSWETRLWIDDMFMITIVQAQAYRATGKTKYIDRAAKEMVMYLSKLQRPNGLFYHAQDVPYCWARGNGWMAAGMSELLLALPDNSPYRKPILDGYRKMMNSLRKYQNYDGMWNQLIDEPDFWPETSGSAMFAYAMILGVKHGWLDADVYTPVARNAWLALVNYINKNDDVTEVCVGTNKKNDKQYYFDRPRIAGDYHGQAPMLWCAYALLSKCNLE
jgi:unsaturated rhamnogalacturonyl hydrolase